MNIWYNIGKWVLEMKLELLEYVKDNLPKGFQPYSIYLIMVDGHEVGRLTLREGQDDERYYDGHVGYSIDEEYQGHGYAYQACLLLKGEVDCDHLIITCDPDNIASLKTIQRLGCEYIETKSIPAHLKKFFTKEEKEKMIFRWNIERM